MNAAVKKKKEQPYFRRKKQPEPRGLRISISADCSAGSQGLRHDVIIQYVNDMLHFR